MAKVILTKGLPGSGKSTWAKQQCLEKGYKRVNKDDLRDMLDAGQWSNKNEKLVLAVRDAIVKLCLERKQTVIVDDTNLSPDHEQTMREIAAAYDAVCTIEDFTHVPLEECIKRDQNRPNYVGEKVIKRMYNKYLRKDVEAPEYDPIKEDCVICDIDGTLAIMGDRSPYNDLEAWKDTPNHTIVNLVRQQLRSRKHIVFVSGRKDRSLDVTLEWMLNHEIIQPGENFSIHMRETTDDRPDWIVKKEIYENYIKPYYNVSFVLDDRNQVVEMWRSMGLTCLQVADGDF